METIPEGPMGQAQRVPPTPMPVASWVVNRLRGEIQDCPEGWRREDPAPC